MEKALDELLAELEEQARARLGTKEKRKKDFYSKGDTLLNTYAVTSNAIHGGMGSVWRVHHNGWNVDLAMKRPQARLFLTDNQKASFVQECEAWINLGLHPYIVSCYYIREIEGIPTIFSEWMTNGSLESRIQDGSLYQGTQEEQLKRILRIAIQFAAGLHYAHETGMIHQDVKPDNLLLTEDWNAKVADFGLTRGYDQLGIKKGNVEGENAGSTIVAASGGYSPAYCSPEQMEGGELSRRTDIYSWAVSVMEMLIGGRPWMNGVVAGLNSEEYLKSSRVQVPFSFLRLLFRCMEIEPEDRPHDFEGIISEIYRIFGEFPGERISLSVSFGSSSESLNNRALSYYDLGRYEEAEKLWMQAMQENPANSRTRFNYALFELRNHKMEGADALLLVNEAFANNWSSSREDGVRLVGKMLWELGGEDKVRSAMYKYWENGDTLLEETLESMLKDGSIRADYELSRIVDMGRYEKSERLYALKRNEIRTLYEAGNIREAVHSIHEAECMPELGDVLFRRDWMDLRALVERKCSRLDSEKSWTEEIYTGIDARDKISFSADSKIILCGERVYEAESGRLLADYGKRAGFDRPLVSEISPDGCFYFRTNKNGFEQVSIRSGKVANTFSHSGAISILVISPDGSKVLVGGKSMFYHIWDIKRRGKKTFMCPGGNLKRALISYDNKTLILQSNGNIVKVDVESQKTDLLAKIDFEKCVSIAADTQFKTLLLAMAQKSVINDRIGIRVFNMETHISTVIDGTTTEDGMTVFARNPIKIAFAENDLDLYYASEHNIWKYSADNKRLLDKFSVQDAINDFAVSRDGHHVAISAAGYLYLMKASYRFIYADPDEGINEEELDRYIELRAEHFANLRDMQEDLPMIREQINYELYAGISERKKHMLAPYRVRSYAWLAVVRNLRSSEEEQLNELLHELEDRGMGFIRRETAAEYIRDVRYGFGMR